MLHMSGEQRQCLRACVPGMYTLCSKLQESLCALLSRLAVAHQDANFTQQNFKKNFLVRDGSERNDMSTRRAKRAPGAVCFAVLRLWQSLLHT
jgi:hypothetical protein